MSKYAVLLFFISFCAALSDEQITNKNVSFGVVVLPDIIPIPENGDVSIQSLLLCLKVTNNSDEILCISRYESALPKLTALNGERLPIAYYRNATRECGSGDFVYLSPGRSTYILTSCSFGMLDGKPSLFGDDNAGGLWKIGNIKKGNYLLSLAYRVDPNLFPKERFKQAQVPGWAGEIETKPIPISFK